MSGEAAATLAMEIHHNLVEIVANGCELDDNEMAALKAMYDGEIAYTDERVGELYETIQRELGETIVIITADHGELFGEDDMLAHKYSMHNAVLNVPMVIQGLSELTDEGIIQHSDVMRTLLEVAGAETETVQGVDLRKDTREYVVSQSPPGSIEPLLEYNPEFDQSKFPTDAYSVIQDQDFKYVACPDAPRFYQLPDERTNLRSEYSERAEQMEKKLTEWLATAGNRVGTGEDIDIDEQMRSRLADLGYLDHEM
jgi:uncharacterized sulfatase